MLLNQTEKKYSPVSVSVALKLCFLALCLFIFVVHSQENYQSTPALTFALLYYRLLVLAGHLGIEGHSAAANCSK